MPVIKPFDPNIYVMLWDSQVIIPSLMMIDLHGNQYEEKHYRDLKSGDIITHTRNVDNVANWFEMPNGGYEVTSIDATGVTGYALSSDGARVGHEMILGRQGMSIMVRVSLSKVVKQQKTEWNGKCFKCGRGTYTGFSSVEHDGECK